MKRILRIPIYFFAIIIASILLLNCRGFPDGLQRIGEIVQTWESSGRPFKVKIDMHIEMGGFMPAATAGAYYAFYSRPAESSDWHKIMTFRHDDPIPIPDGQVGFVDDETAYFFIGPFFAVTRDKGVSWTIWDAYKNIPNIQCCYYGVIDGIQLRPDGTGTLTLEPRAVQGTTQLTTRDFGLHWDP